MPHVITLTGASGSGKSTAVEYFQDPDYVHDFFEPKLIAKYTTRSARLDEHGEVNEHGEVICVDTIPAKCDLVYEQYRVRYGLELKNILEPLANGLSPIVILNDVRVVEDVRAALGKLVHSIFIFRKTPTLEWYHELAKTKGSMSEEEILRRYHKAQIIGRIYTENIQLFDYVILNMGSLEELKCQVARIVEGLKRPSSWPLKNG